MRVFSVPVSAPFLRTVIAALVDGRLVDGFEARTDPARLAQATLYLPTLRAGRMAREIFLDELKTDAVVLPRIVALGDIDEDELAFAQAELARHRPRWKFPRHGRAAAPPAAGATGRRLGEADPAGGCGAGAAGGRRAGLDAGAGRRSGAADGRHGDAQGGVERARRAGAGCARPILAAHAAFPQHRQDRVAGYSRRTRPDRAGRAARSVDRGRSRAPDRASRRPGDRGGLDRIDAIDRKIAACRRRPAAGRGGAAGARYRSRRRRLAIDRRRQGCAKAGSPRSRHRTIRNSRCTRCSIAFGIKRGDVEILGEPAPHGREVLVSEAMRPSNATAQWHRRLAEPDIAEKIAAA